MSDADWIFSGSSAVDFSNHPLLPWETTLSSSGLFGVGEPALTLREARRRVEDAAESGIAKHARGSTHSCAMEKELQDSCTRLTHLGRQLVNADAQRRKRR